MERALHGRTVLVTGGSRGIGRAVVLRAVEAGARVAFCARRLGDLTSEVLDQIARRGGEALALAADVADEASVQQLFDHVVARMGPIDAVVNNAGISHEALLVATESERWDRVVGVNLTGAFLVARRALSDFLRFERRGRIVSLGSLAQHGTSSNASYAASKGGLEGLTQTIAAQYGERGIRANLVLAGYVETELTSKLSEAAHKALIARCPQQRAATPDEIARVVTYLSSDASSAMNGRSVHVAGGMREMPF